MTRVSSFYLRVKVQERYSVMWCCFLKCSAKILQPAQWTLELNVTVFSYLNIGSPITKTGGTTRNNYLKSIHTGSQERLLMRSPRKYMYTYTKETHTMSLPDLLSPPPLLHMTFSSNTIFPRCCSCRLSEIVQMCCVYLTLINN